MFLVKRMKAAYDICVGSDAFTQTERDHVHFYLAVRSIVFKLTKGDAPDLRADERQGAGDDCRGAGKRWRGRDLQAGTRRYRRGRHLRSRTTWPRSRRSSCPTPRSSCSSNCWPRRLRSSRRSTGSRASTSRKQFKALVDRYNERSEQDVLRSEVLEEFTDEIIDLYHAIQKEKRVLRRTGHRFRGEGLLRHPQSADRQV